MNRPELPPILNTKEYNSLVDKYKQEEEKQEQQEGQDDGTQN